MGGQEQRVCLRVGGEIKAQYVRLLDVFVIGPLMIAGGYALDDRGSKLAGPALALTGVATIVYNGRNYVRVKKQLRLQRVGQIG